MTFEEVLAEYQKLNEIQQNNNGDWDYDFRNNGIKFSTEGTMDKMELPTIALLQDFFDKGTVELKNGTKGLETGNILVEHHQRRRPTTPVIDSGIVISKAGYWFYNLGDTAALILKREFLLWCLERTTLFQLKNFEIPSQLDKNTGYAYLISFEKLPYLIRMYEKDLQNPK